jgi:hypothetical protein
VRYAERTTRRDEVCPFYNADFDWISETAIVRINEAVTGGFESARTRIGAAPRLIRIDLERAFGSHRLCDRTVGLLEEKRFSRWDAAGAVNEVEWITRYQTLEPFHPNYWAQLALRNCLRRAFNGGLPTEPREGRCRIRAAGLTALGEPDMEL